MDVVIVGAGPVGLTLANILGLQGVRTLIVEERSTLIDYPRGVGLDDEALRTFQSIGLVQQILPHTVPNQILRFFDANRRLLAEMAPPDARFGWPRRNGFVQPMVDAELLTGLDRFDHVEVRWSRRMEACRVGRRCDGRSSRGESSSTVKARYVVGCDGGRSATRRLMGVSFDGTTSPTRWLVIDSRERPAGTSQQRGRRRPRASVRLDLHRARNPALRVHDSPRRIRRTGRGSGVRQAHARAAGPVSRARRRDPAPPLHPPLADRRSVPQRPADCSPEMPRT